MAIAIAPVLALGACSTAPNAVHPASGTRAVVPTSASTSLTQPTSSSRPTPAVEPLQTPSDASLVARSRAVTFESSDGVRLAGRLFGSGDTAVVLSHMIRSDQEPWWWMASIFADHGIMAMTYDSRGTCPGGVGGCSHGRLNPGAVDRDILGAVAYLRSIGARRVVVGGASLGGTASLWVASKHPDAVVGVFTLSAVSFFPPYDITSRVIHAIRAPKLFVAGANDPSAGPYVPTWRLAATPPVRAVVLDSGTHGTDFFGDQDFSARVRSTILRFVRGIAG